MGNYDAPLADTAGAPDWRPLTIAQHAAMLAQLRDSAARAAAEQWGNLAALMDATRSHVREYEGPLRDDWRSRAAEPFFEHIEGTNKSLDEWGQAAKVNEGRLNRLADAIETAQTEMEALYASYKAEVADIDSNDALWADNFLGTDPGPEAMAKMVAEKTEQSRAIMQRLSDVFDGTVLDEAPKFGGPQTANVPTGAEMARALGLGAPGGAAPGAPAGGAGGAPPAAPGGPGGRTGMLMGPSVASLGPPPAAPRGPAPGAPAVPPRAPVGPAPAAPVAPVAYGPSGPPPAAPTMPAGAMG
ncbi:MAG: hypothetical protein M3381_12140, partial [Actinomycetota bacterium]|nr:hypothetical protein [Actinomycetota bacterium]